MELEKPEKCVHLKTSSKSLHEPEEIVEAAMDKEPDTEDSQRAEACIRINVTGKEV